MHSLYSRLSISFLVIIAAVGAGFFLVERWSTQQYYEELTQRLNSSIAMYVTDQTTLIDAHQVNRPELERLAERAMVINPTVEVYLLDNEGNILAHALPPESVLLKRIDLGPLRALIDGKANLPILGQDPRSPGHAKVFSAAEVVSNGKREGYLYVVLGGKQYEALANSIRSGYVRKVSLGAISALVAGGFLVGLLVFGVLTRRLKRLTAAVNGFANNRLNAEFPNTPDTSELRAADSMSGKDEIGQLNAAFVSMADKICEQFEQLQESDRLRRELISNVSHDLRTPLTTMHGYIDTLLLKNTELSEKERENYLRIAHKHTGRLRVLIDDLFELSKLDSGSMQLSPEPFPLAELLQDVVQDFSLEAKRRGINILLKKDPARTMVMADIGLMQRVLENLIRNALDNTPHGGTITLSIDPRPDQVAVSIADTGRGIPEEQIDDIFERYFRASNSHVENSDSTGLGLAIVKRILELHGSRITVESRVNEGTRFEFNLPSSQAA